MQDSKSYEKRVEKYKSELHPQHYVWYEYILNEYNTPPKIAAATCFYTGSLLNNTKITQSDVAKYFDISAVSISRYYTKILENIGQFHGEPERATRRSLLKSYKEALDLANYYQEHELTQD